MGEAPCGSDAGLPLLDEPVGARAMCVWLGTLASWRPGFIGRLVREYRSVGALLERPPSEIVAFATRRDSARRRQGLKEGAGRASGAKVPTDADRFAAVLRAGPETCLTRAERRPPGDLVVAWCDPLYPDQLRDLDDPPLCLFVRGADAATVRERLSAIVDAPLVAIVGTRGPSPYGEEMARTLGGDLTRAGVVVVSGLAMGIDAVAQAAAVDAAAVLTSAHGGRARVRRRRRVPAPERAAVCSGRGERARPQSSSPGACRPAPGAFPARNRVMASLGRAVVLVEGAERSGARITAGFAVDIGRDVLCVPGEAGRRLSAAPHLLLRDGARVCESAADVLRAIAVNAPGPGVAAAAPGARGDLPALVLDHGGGAIRDVLRALGAAALTVDELWRRCRLPASKVAAAVSELEVEGLARSVDGGRYRLVRR